FDFLAAGKPKFIQPLQRQQRPPPANRRAERRPLAARALEERYFVFGERDEIAVRIFADTAFGCRRAEASERRQSSLVIVLKSASFVRPREVPPAESRDLAGEEVLHDGSADMREPSASQRANAKDFSPPSTRSNPANHLSSIK